MINALSSIVGVLYNRYGFCF